MKLQTMLAAGMCAAAMMSGTALHAAAAPETLFYGDVDRDGRVGVTDIVLLQKHLLGLQKLGSEEAVICADINADECVDVYDLALLKRYVIDRVAIPVFAEETPTEPMTEPTEPSSESTEPEPAATVPAEPETTETVTEATTVETTTEKPETTGQVTEPTTEETTAGESETTEPETEPSSEPAEIGSEFIAAPLAEMYGSLPSQGEGRMIAFVVDFPDCSYGYDPDLELIDSALFGTEDDPDDPSYPFNSVHNYYSRASKGAVDLTGAVYRYTMQYDKAYYETTVKDGAIVKDSFKMLMVEEILDAFEDLVDYKAFDADHDKVIDTALFIVPNAAGDDNWWPCSGQFADMSYRADRRSVGHVIIGNKELASESDRISFVSAYAHETGHCFGLPDYYLYYSEDFIGFHGTAGVDLMDVDDCSDLDCFSKLMLGWYREPEVQVYDQSVGGAQTFTLTNAQSDGGNCLILPYGNWSGGCDTEYMILEFITEDRNNSAINTIYGFEPALIVPGVRAFHVNAAIGDNGWWKYFMYENGSKETNQDDEGIRLLRLVNDAEGGYPFTTGDVIDGTISGFHWYDANEGETVDTGYTVEIGALTDGSYTVTVSMN